MPGTTSCNPCDATGLAEKSVRFQDILNPLYAEGRVLETWGQYEDFLRYETIFFDVVPQKDPTTGEVYVTYKFKDGLAASSELTLVDNYCKVGWYEPKLCGEFTELSKAASTWETSIYVKSLKALGGIKKDSTVLVTKKDGNPVNGLYLASDPDGVETADGYKLVLWAALTTDLPKGSKVRRWAYLRDRGCGVEIDNTVELDAVDVYSSKFRTISISHEINACDLNKDYLVSGGAQAILDARLKKGDYEAIKEFIHAVFYDRNIYLKGRGTTMQVSETYGLFPAMAKAQENGLKVAFDLGECCNDELSDCVNARNQIQAFFDIVFNKTAESGMFDNEITVAMNGLARTNLFKMQPYFQDYGNVGFMSGEQWDILVREPRINYAGKVIDFKYLPILDDYRIPVMLTIPLDKVGVYQKKYNYVNPETLKVEQQKINGTIQNGTPVLRYINATDDLAAKLGECNKIVGDMEFAVIWMWVDKGAYRFIKNFGSCLESQCKACELNDTDILYTTVEE